MDAGKMKKSGGYSLIEVMVAMVISLIVLSGVYRVITDETVRTAREEAVLDMQNNARAAITRISLDLRRTGFFGCGGKLGYPASYTFAPPIVFTNDAAATSTTSDEGTDAITLEFLGGDVPLISVDASSTSSSDFKLGRAAFVNGDELLVTDCDEYAVFTKTNGSTTTPSATVAHADLNRIYGAMQPARVYDFQSSAYRVKDGALILGVDDEVADNIEDLQFEFIEDTDNDGDLSDQDWQQTFADPAEVRAVRVWVLAMSDTAYSYTDNNTYDYPNSPYHSGEIPAFSTNGAGGSPASRAPLANDGEHRFRYLASATIYLRNAGIL